MLYSTVKAMHIIGFVTWFAGLFYIVRLFIYDVEASARAPGKPEDDPLVAQLRVMERRLFYGITWPAMVLTLFFGTWLLGLYGQFGLPWVHIKLALVAGLVWYHLRCQKILTELRRGRCSRTSRSLRFFNEVATLFLVAIVFLAVYKGEMTIARAAIIAAVFIAVVGGGFLAYQRLRST